MAKHKKLHKKNATHSSSKKNVSQRKQQRTKQLVSIFLGLLMVASIFGIWASSSSQQQSELEYRGVEFDSQRFEELNTYVFTTTLDNQELYFFSMPQDILSIPVSENLTAYLEDKDMFIVTSNPNDQAASFYDFVRYDLDQYSQRQIGGATTIEHNQTTLPVITCENATQNIPVIEFVMGNQTSIDINDSCIVVQGRQPQDFLYLRDRLLYSFTNIINQ